MSKPQFFTVKILTKPYLKKYLQSLYGTPIIFTTKNFFGSVVIALLEKPAVPREKKDKIQLRIDSFTTTLEIYCPLWFLKQHKYGFDISEAHIIAVNKMFEQRFTEDLFKFCKVLNLCGVDIEDGLEEFCKMHSLEIDEDITIEGLKQKEYRYRKHLTDIDAGISKNKNKSIQISFF